MSQAGDRLKMLRIDRGLTQRRVAELADITVTTVSRIENGHHTPELETVFQLARALGVRPSALTGDETYDQAIPEPATTVVTP